MHTVNIDEELGNLPADADIVVAVAADNYPGCLQYVTAEQHGFADRYAEWVSRHSILNEIFHLQTFDDLLKADGWTVLYDTTCQQIFDDYTRWREPLNIDGLTLTKNGEPSTLFPFQSFGLRKALERDFHFFNWSAGAGKSAISAAGAQELVNRDQIDTVLACTLMKLKHNLADYYRKTTQLSTVVTDGTPERRRKIYASDHQVYIMNYEKLWVDADELAEMISGQRVLLVLDEVQKILTDGPQTKARKALTSLVRKPSKVIAWPMTATAVGTGPLRYRDIFSVAQPPATNPLGSKSAFTQRYAASVTENTFRTRTGRRFTTVQYEWDANALHDVRHRVSDRVHIARKTDPGIRESFQGTETVVIPVQMSDSDRRLYDAIVGMARESREREESLAPYYRLLRLVCSNPAAIAESRGELAEILCAEYPDLVVPQHSSKIEMAVDLVAGLQDANEKAVAFSEWTNLGIHLLSPHFEKAGVRHVCHWGVGQSAKESHAVVNRFKTDPAITLLLSSDAGSHGLSLQEARYVIQLEPVYSYDVFMQRSERINRADSYLHGLTNYVLVTENSVEQRIWSICHRRRDISAAVQGTSERFSSRGEEPTTEDMEWFIFGDDIP